MIKSVTFTNRFGRSLHCILSEPERSSFAIRKIEGLGPGLANVSIHSIATADGGYFGAAKFSDRQISITFQPMEIGMDGRYVPIEESRLKSYEFFAPKSKIQVVVESDNRLLVIEGYVERNEPEIFEQVETIVVDIRCPFYYFKMIGQNGTGQEVSIYGNGAFTFPFENTPVGEYHLEFGEVSADQTYMLPYYGDAETGIELEISFTGDPVSTITIVNEPLGNSSSGSIGFTTQVEEDADIFQWTDLNVGENVITMTISKIAEKLTGRYSGNVTDSGNMLVISTVTGKKSAYLQTFEGGEIKKYNVIDAIDVLNWIKLYPGRNKFTVRTNNAAIGHFAVAVRYEALYMGV